MQGSLTLGEAGGDTLQVRSERQRMWQTFTRNRVAVVGLILVLLIAAVAIAAPLLSPHDPLDQSARDKLTPPSAEYPLGRDNFGRDILSRIIYGARISLLVGITSGPSATSGRGWAMSGRRITMPVCRWPPNGFSLS